MATSTDIGAFIHVQVGVKDGALRGRDEGRWLLHGRRSKLSPRGRRRRGARAPGRYSASPRHDGLDRVRHLTAPYCGIAPMKARVTNHIERVIQHYKAQKTTSFERNAREAAWSVMFAVVSDMQKKERYGS